MKVKTLSYLAARHKEVKNLGAVLYHEKAAAYNWLQQFFHLLDCEGDDHGVVFGDSQELFGGILDLVNRRIFTNTKENFDRSKLS